MRTRQQGKERATAIYTALTKARRLIERLDNDLSLSLGGIEQKDLDDTLAAIDTAKKIIEAEV